MLKNLVRAFLICRLELQRVPLSLDAVLLAWLSRPVIEVLLEERGSRDREEERLRRRLDQVYPF